MIHISNEIYKYISLKIKDVTSKHKPYWSGSINDQDWCFYCSIIIYNDNTIVPIWWDFSFLNDAENDFSFETLINFITNDN